LGKRRRETKKIGTSRVVVVGCVLGGAGSGKFPKKKILVTGERGYAEKYEKIRAGHKPLNTGWGLTRSRL